MRFCVFPAIFRFLSLLHHQVPSTPIVKCDWHIYSLFKDCKHANNTDLLIAMAILCGFWAKWNGMPVYFYLIFGSFKFRFLFWSTHHHPISSFGMFPCASLSDRSVVISFFFVYLFIRIYFVFLFFFFLKKCLRLCQI